MDEIVELEFFFSLFSGIIMLANRNQLQLVYAPNCACLIVSAQELYFLMFCNCSCSSCVSIHLWQLLTFFMHDSCSDLLRNPHTELSEFLCLVSDYQGI